MDKNSIYAVITDINFDYSDLIEKVGITLEQGRNRVVSAVSSAMVQTYWEIGRHIVEYEQNGHEKAEYGSDVLAGLGY